ncbi:TetR/AcrR family transcriptional regulator [Alkaliphilus transvaalensis]|uniref:TetR/AcrR family transcriptional regulator n=1 Tax=Alkaliphilus transvaalensis TaxID=114628 RepID=UPI000A57CFBE|nr:TetR/AcrR family transcriptional regulator [Alkaliphilus transvaalensis]
MDQEKQKRILEAAYGEFADHGFKNASTNRIVKAAGIGKGMLFYYFKSKTDLYKYLIEYGIDFVINEYFSLLNDSEGDFIERYKQAAKVKLRAYIIHPYIFNFFGTLYINLEAGISKEFSEQLMNRLMEVRSLGYSKIFSNIDTSLFREDLPAEKVIKMIHWLIEGYEKELTNQLKGQKLSAMNFDPYWEDFFNYLDTLKLVFYKN